MVTELVIAGAALGAWLAVFGMALLLTRPRVVGAAPPTQEFGGAEPPAVVSLLVNGWEVTEDAAESTLLDLAARRLLELRQPGNDPAQTTIHLRGGDSGPLTGYERRVLDRVRAVAVGGVVPLTALTFRDPAEAKGWAKGLRASVVADARARGLSRRRFTPAIAGLLTAGAGVAALAVFVAALHHAARTHPLENQAIGAALFTFVAMSGLVASVTGERDTPAGRAAAARWLGLRAYLRGDESFAALPPSAVAVWDRYLSYGDALGATRVCAAVIDLGMGNRRRVWSSYGGTWHRMRVRYPRLGTHHGAKAVPLVFWSLVSVAAGYAVLRYRHLALTAVPVRWHDVADLLSALLALALLARGGYRLVRTIVDLAAPAALTGEVLWCEVWKSTSNGENRPAVPWLYYLAVDDGRADRTTAWGLPSALHGRCAVGDVVRMRARPWSRRIVDVTVEQRRAANPMTASTAD